MDESGGLIHEQKEAAAERARRLGLNRGAYQGERIEIFPVIERMRQAAARNGWEVESFLDASGFSLLAFKRLTAAVRSRVYLSTGIHGDEPAGPLAMLELIEQNDWPEGVDFWICPCLNPTGFPLSRRENADCIDLNRDYRHLQSREVQAHTAWLLRQPAFDVTILLHEDWEADGFYLFELNPENKPTLAEPIVARVAEMCPIESSGLVDNMWPCRNGIVRPQIDPKDRPQWPEAIWLIANKCKQSYTLEAPSDFPMQVRVKTLVAAVRAALACVGS